MYPKCLLKRHMFWKYPSLVKSLNLVLEIYKKKRVSSPLPVGLEKSPTGIFIDKTIIFTMHRSKADK